MLISDPRLLPLTMLEVGWDQDGNAPPPSERALELAQEALGLLDAAAMPLECADADAMGGIAIYLDTPHKRLLYIGIGNDGHLLVLCGEHENVICNKYPDVTSAVQASVVLASATPLVAATMTTTAGSCPFCGHGRHSFAWPACTPTGGVAAHTCACTQDHRIPVVVIPATPKCGACLFLGDDHGDNRCTFRCTRLKGHEGAHEEAFIRRGSDKRPDFPVTITFAYDERFVCERHGVQDNDVCEPCADAPIVCKKHGPSSTKECPVCLWSDFDCPTHGLLVGKSYCYQDGCAHEPDDLWEKQYDVDTSSITCSVHGPSYGHLCPECLGKPFTCPKHGGSRTTRCLIVGCYARVEDLWTKTP